MAESDHEAHEEALPSLIPASAEARTELLTDENGLRQLCEEYYTRLAAGARSVIGVRVVGRVIADIHRELSLRVPDEDSLYRAMMLHACGGSFTLDRENFVAFVERVLVQCIQGGSLGDEEHGLLDAGDANTAVTEPLASVGAITVHAYKLDGTSATFAIDDSLTTEMLQQRIEEQLGVPTIVQRLLLGTSVLEPGRLLFEQGVTQGATITVTRCKPQATLLRIRRVNLGDDVRTASKQAEPEAAAAPTSTTYPYKASKVICKRPRRSHSLAKLAPKQPEADCRHERQRASDVRIRPVNLGRH